MKPMLQFQREVQAEQHPSLNKDAPDTRQLDLLDDQYYLKFLTEEDERKRYAVFRKHH